MRTVGQILKEERESKFYTLEEVERATKIRKDFLQALEADNYQVLPPPTFVQGFIKNYAKFLNLDPEKLLAIFRREFSDKRHPPRVLDALSNPLNKSKFNMTPHKFISALVLGLISLFLIYLWVEYRFLVGAPFLEVSYPPDQAQVEGEMVKVEGKTDPEAKVTLNNQSVQVDLAGNFSQEVNLSGSASRIIVTATNKYGKTARAERVVYLKK